ncbi:hypothetical protein ACS0OQ_04215 [Stenotrophomonas riyadhensis]|uniref:hypothetical protein n=1 Tax=Stenotrophomonas riyadhensis TaxID=2859893 RepID=UPI003F9B2B3F
MSTDKTLADAQPGGRVRLGDQAERPRFKAWWDAARPLEGSAFHYEIAWAAWQAALSAQPSPGGQDALATALEVFERRRADIPYEVYEQVKAVCAVLAARQPVGELDPANLTPPDGFVLVPVEPTEAMLRAGGWVEPPDAHGQQYIETQGAAQCWKLMMNARPDVSNPIHYQHPAQVTEAMGCLRQALTGVQRG